MANQKMSTMPAAGTIGATDYLAGIQGGVNKTFTLTVIKAAFSAVASTGAYGDLTGGIAAGTGLSLAGVTLSLTAVPYTSVTSYTLATAKILGRTTAGSGAAEEIAAGTGLTLAAGSLDLTASLYTGASWYTLNTARMLGRTTAGAGAAEEISVGAGLALAAGSLTATAYTAGTGITVTSFAISITAAAYTAASWYTMSTARLLGRTTAASGAAEEITVGALLSFTAGTLTLANTAVSAAAYGDSSHYTTFTVDAQGRLTAAASVALGTAAFQTTGTFLQTANNLSDVTAATARANLGFAAQVTSSNITASGTQTLNWSSGYEQTLYFPVTSGTAQTLTFATSNVSTSTKGSIIEGTIINTSGQSWTLAWPAWVSLGGAIPTTLATGKTLVFSAESGGTTDGATTVAWQVQS